MRVAVRVRHLMIARRLIVGAFLAGLTFVPGRAAVLIHDYSLRGSLESVSGGPALDGIGGSITALGYVFAAHPFSLGTSAPVAANITVEFSFTFRVQSGDLARDANFAALAVPAKYDITAPLVLQPAVPGSLADAPHDVFMSIVLTRDADSNRVTGYVNGQPEFVLSQDIAATAAALTASFAFTLESSTVEGPPFLGGRIDSVRVYDGALNAQEVSALFAAATPLAIPEPSTYAMLGAGLVALFLRRRSRKSRPGSL